MSVMEGRTVGLEEREHIGSSPNAPSCPVSDARTHNGEPAAIDLHRRMMER
jgi:hypothetical protein